jgi:hypothetical protein
MEENPDNIRIVCPDHSPKPMGFEGDPVSLIGRYVKRAFEQDGRVEHMWVEVKKITDDGVLCGVLDNDPVVVNDVKCGDTVKVELCEIEEVFG